MYTSFLYGRNKGMPKPQDANEIKFEKTLAEYKDKYNVDQLDSPNDVASLRTMIRNQILIEQLQSRLDDISRDDKVDPMEIKKILDSIVALSQTNMQYERSLGIDRKTRKTDQADSVADYILKLKSLAVEFLDDDDRLLKVNCDDCAIMIGRISGVYDTTYFYAVFQCPQCKKHKTVTRKERDIFFDVKDANWRRKYPIEIVQPKRNKTAPVILAEDDIVLGIDTEE